MSPTPVRQRTSLSSRRRYSTVCSVRLGTLASVDQYMNVQMGNAVEYIDEQNKGPLGDILIRCNNILYISGIEDADDDGDNDDAMA